MKKWIIIGLSISSVVIWFAVIWVFLGMDEPVVQDAKHTTTQRTDLSKLSINQLKHKVSEPPETSIESTTPEITQTDKEQKTLQTFENENMVSIDDILSALDLP